MSERPQEIRIVNWQRFQHYKKRSPPWIRLYRDLIDREEYRALSDSAARLLVELWLLASEFEPGGRIPFDLALLAWKTGRASTDASIMPALQECATQGFIELPANASANASANTSMSTPQRGEAEGRGRTHTPRAQEERDQLTDWLGGFADILDDCPPAQDPKARSALYMHFGPPGMRARAWETPDGTSVPAEDRPRIFALALSGYAGEGNDGIVTSEFAGMLKRVIRDEAGASARTPESATGFQATDADFEPGGLYYVESTDG